ncbi:MAG TPA: glycine betaine ABC transporter substrate-binding protein, partial [Burkholderiales bacterium]|nr:glycine betaine ABC transporter substrate-binding protein [Burkholderiales bacterium]
MTALPPPLKARFIRSTVAAFTCCVLGGSSFAAQLTVGSKRFTESYILGEIVAQTARQAGEAQVTFKPGLGNTAVVFAALKSGAIDVYPEYSGTISYELLGGKSGTTLADINRALASSGLAASIPLGFSNTYALAMADKAAQQRGLSNLTALARHADLVLGLSQEFLNRKDGWPALKRAYGLSFAPRGLDHGLAYEALAAGRIDVMDIYSTDAKIARYGLRVLADDQKFFPAYAALLLHRTDLPQRLPQTWAALAKLEGTIPAERMIAMNAAAELDSVPFAQIADDFVNKGKAHRTSVQHGFLARLFGEDFWRITWQHLTLVFVSLAASCAAGIPLGIWAGRSAAARNVIFPVVSVLQTVPSLALLAFLIALLNQIGTLPALVALFLYGLLPIVRNTAAGLAEIKAGLTQAAAALGLQRGAILRLIELPLASRTILAGVKTSAVINVGTATIAAFIGAGGYGERIVAGLAVNDNALLLAGAVPAA